MRKRTTLQTLQLLAEYAEAEHSRKLSEKMRTLTSEERRLGQITGYLAEYEQQGRGQQKPTFLGALRGRRNFVERLRGAVVEQHGLVELHRNQAEEHMSQWRAARARALAMQRLGERQAEQEQERLDRREQANLDEMGLALRGRQPRR
jgi:flagellar protein FliJ